MAINFEMNLLQQCLSEGALTDAWAKVLANEGCAGVDGITLQDFRTCALSNLSALRQDVLNGTYQSQALLGMDIPKASGRLRHLAIPTIRDRIIQTAVAQKLTPLLDPGFDESSFAYRSGRSAQQATTKIITCRNLGLRWVVDADIRNYFDSLDHAILLRALFQKLPDYSLTPLLTQWLHAPIKANNGLQVRNKGVPQGSPISPLLANLYLHPLDAMLAAENHTLVRYADDFLVLCRSKDEAEAALRIVRTKLTELHLELNEEKSRLTHFEAGFRFLGVRFENNQVTPVDPDAAPWVMPTTASTESLPVTSYADTQPELPAVIKPSHEVTRNRESVSTADDIVDPDAVRLEDAMDGLNLPRSLYVTTQGVRITKQASRLLVSQGQEVVARVPLKQLDQIVIHGNALMSTAVIRFCHENGVGLSFADSHGVRASTLDCDSRLPVLKNQCVKDDDMAFRLNFARACVRGKVHNSLVVLRRYTRRESPIRVLKAISILGRSLKRLDSVMDLDCLRGIEGRAARAHFAAISDLIPTEWNFSGRNRHPPRDPINALLSYGYAVLTQVVQMAVSLAHLHPGFGHLHAAVGARPALVCDLMEEFRPLVVDAVVLALARGHTLHPERDFSYDADGCRIAPAAKQAFIGRLEAKLAAPARHASGRATLHRLIRSQAMRYSTAISSNNPYFPFLA